jgi:hypothetical protein
VIVELPEVNPVTIPLADPIVATAVLLLLHEPGMLASPRVVVVPAHNPNVPVIADGLELTTST